MHEFRIDYHRVTCKENSFGERVLRVRLYGIRSASAVARRGVLWVFLDAMELKSLATIEAAEEVRPTVARWVLYENCLFRVLKAGQ
jgi:hypothetical protein